MNHTTYLLFVFSISLSFAASKVTLPNGRSYFVSDWSLPVMMEIQAANGGTLSVLKRRAQVSESNEDNPSYPIEFVYEPNSRQVLLNSPGDAYFAFNGRIFSARVPLRH